MELRLALDHVTLEEAKAMLRELADVIDIVEIGTPFIVQDGVGANIVTVLGLSDDATIRSAVVEAKKSGQEIMVDMIGVADLERRAGGIEALAVDYICVRTASDVQATGKNPLDELQRVKKIVSKAKTAVAGGIRLGTLAGRGWK